MQALGMTILGYLIGSVPFSLLLGQIFLQTDIRDFGADRNPGSANAWRAGKWKVGFPALLLDFLKGALPVGVAFFVLNISGWVLVPVALAPVIGHAFSIFLKFQGGKALAVTFGIWTGLTLYRGPIILGLLFVVFYFLLDSDAWAVIFSMLGFLIALLITSASATLLAIWLGNLFILIWKHRRELRQPIRMRTRRASLVKG